jgi:hypothetical protein
VHCPQLECECMLQVHDVMENLPLSSDVCKTELCLNIRGELRLGNTLDNTDPVPSSWPSGVLFVQKLCRM